MHIYSTHSRILFSHKKEEILPFVTTWMDLKCIMLSDLSQRGRISYDLTYLCHLKNSLKKYKKRDSICGFQMWGVEGGRIE